MQMLAMLLAAEVLVTCTVDGKPWKAGTEGGAIGQPAVAAMSRQLGITLREQGKPRPSLQISAPADSVSGKSGVTVKESDGLSVTWTGEGTAPKPFFVKTGTFNLAKHDAARGTLDATLEATLHEGFLPKAGAPELKLSCTFKSLPVRVQQPDGTYK